MLDVSNSCSMSLNVYMRQSQHLWCRFQSQTLVTWNSDPQGYKVLGSSMVIPDVGVLEAPLRLRSMPDHSCLQF